MAHKRFNRLPTKDPRTIARDIPIIFNILFPRLTSGVVTQYNQLPESLSSISSLNSEMTKSSYRSAAFIYEMGYAKANQIISGEPENWQVCHQKAYEKQSRFYDFNSPHHPTEEDKKIIEKLARNLVQILISLKQTPNENIILNPEIAGFSWIANSRGDYAISSSLIEAKCSKSDFSMADFRQVLIYWLLSYLDSLKSQNNNEWENLILVNPRLNKILKINVETILPVISDDKSKPEIVHKFRELINLKKNK